MKYLLCEQCWIDFARPPTLDVEIYSHNSCDRCNSRVGENVKAVQSYELSELQIEECHAMIEARMKTAEILMTVSPRVKETLVLARNGLTFCDDAERICRISRFRVDLRDHLVRKSQDPHK